MEEAGLWRSTHLFGFLAFLFVLFVGWALIDMASSPRRRDSVLSQAKSPNGQVVARLWCRTDCSGAAPYLLTLSPPGRDIKEGYAWACEGCDVIIPVADLPRQDEVMELWADRRPELRWHGAKLLLVQVTCLGSTRRRMVADPGGVAIKFHQAPDIASRVANCALATSGEERR